MWREYLERKRAARLSEARQVWGALSQAGGTDSTVLALDFVHVSPDRERAEALQVQLSENYAVTLEPAADGYWLVKGTTRPYGVTLGDASHTAWVQFMCELAESHGCVFSAWSLDAPSEGISVSSDAFEGGS